MKRLFFVGILLLVGLWIYLSSAPAGNLAIVKIEGGIFESDPVLRELEEIEQSDEVKAAVIRIDSPGGSVGAAQEIHDAVRRLAEKKKVVASFGSMATSGGYYVALPAHRILANAGTITGSIGVRMEVINVEELLKQLRLRSETLKSGDFKDIGSPTRPMRDEERVFFQDLLKKLHAQFKEAVVQGRKLEPGKVEGLADGRIFTGREAMEQGLVDEIGNLQQAVKVASQMAGIEGEPKVFYPEKRYRSLWERFWGEADAVFESWLFRAARPRLRVVY